MKLLVIIPAYNEALNIERVVSRLQPHLQPGWDYLVVNDGSRDGTAEICRRNGFPLLDLPVNLGLAGAVQAGLRYAEQNGYDYAIQFDGDGQHRPEYIGVMLERMERDDLDMVIGSRFVTEKKPRSLRMLGNTLLACAIRLTTAKSVSDPTSGMRMMNRKLIKEFSENMNYGPEPDTISYLIKNGARMAECQVKMDERIAGTSYLNFARSVRYMVNMFVSILFIQLFRPKRVA